MPLALRLLAWLVFAGGFLFFWRSLRVLSRWFPDVRFSFISDAHVGPLCQIGDTLGGHVSSRKDTLGPGAALSWILEESRDQHLISNLEQHCFFCSCLFSATFFNDFLV